MRYFDHDTTASMDDKILVLRMEQGNAAVDVYWTLLEKMYHDEAPVDLSETNPETKALTVRLALGLGDIKTYVSSMVALGLFDVLENDENIIVSKRAMENIEAYRDKCEKARQNGKKGGRKPTTKPKQKPTANQTLTDSKPTAKLRKEKKGIETYTVSNPVPLGGADADKPAPPAADYTAIFDEVDAQYGSEFLSERAAKTAEFRAAYAEMEAAAIPCPDDLNPFKAAE